MNIDREKQLDVIAQTHQLLNSTEKKRMLLRFQRGVVDLENDRFGILQNTEFVDKLLGYLYTLYQKGPDGNILKALEKIGFCACNADVELRERAVFILSMFTEKISREEDNPEFLEAVARLLVNWLQIETEYLSGFQFVCKQLQTMLQKMLRQGYWYQAENLILVLSQIQKGVIKKNNLIRKTINKVHSALADEAFLKGLVDVYLNKKEDRRDIAESLLMHFGSKAAAVLVQTLIDCQDKEKRFTLIEFIPSTGKVALPVIEFCLKQKPPWYVIRNFVIIIARMDDPAHYDMVRPYLVHKDIRVQLQVLTCITKLGGAQMRDRLIEALTCINDELKQQVVIQLGNMGGKDVGEALCGLLEKRGEFAIHVKDELILTICAKIKFMPSERAVKVMKELIAERMHRFGEGDDILQAAQDTLVSMELKNTGNPSGILSPVGASSSDALRVPVATEEEFDSLLSGSVPEDDLELEPLDEPSEAPLVVSPKEEQKVEETVEPLLVVEKKPVRSKKDIMAEAEKNLDDPDSANHFTIWAELYEEMTTEEFTAFHTALNHKTYKPGEMIVAGGDMLTWLFFFDRGTVRLVRNQKQEEVHLNAMGAGDLIGSDIFLSGNAWNISLYAKDKVNAHVFDLEEMLKLRVQLPQLAEKILTFCAGYDVLPALLRVLDDPDTAGTEKARIDREGSRSKNTEGEVEQGTILQKMRGGLCFTLPVMTTEKISHLLQSLIRFNVRLSSGATTSLPATIVGTVRSAAKPEEAIVFVRFLRPLPDNHYACEAIEFTPPR